MTPAPIALFVYNRPEHTERTIRALQANALAPRSFLHVFADGPKSPSDAAAVKAVRSLIRSVDGFASVEVHEAPANRGLAGSIINGVTTVCRQHGSVIVLEDDLVVSPHFLQYMNDALAMYEDTPEVVSIHGYIYPIRGTIPETFFLRGADCWGWATWQRGWDVFSPDGPALLEQLETRGLTNEFDFDGTYAFTQMLRDQIRGVNNSWAIRWYASAFLQGRLTLYPGRSLVANIGNDGSGTHSRASTDFDVKLDGARVDVTRLAPIENREMRAACASFFRDLQAGDRAQAEPNRMAHRVWRRLRRFCKPR